METLILQHRTSLQNLKLNFRRDLIDKIHWKERLVGIKGARGVGKTTLCLQYITENYGISNECLYVSMDNVLFPYNNLIELADEFVKRGGTHLFIDEIHKYPNWIRELKNIYDLYPSLQVVFTGSSVMQLNHSVADLSRRAVMHNMVGLSFREYLQIETGKTLPAFTVQEIIKSHEEIAFNLLREFKPFKYFDLYLKNGYYPYYLPNTETYSLKLSQLIQQVIEVDLPMLARIEYEQIAKLKRLLHLLSESVPFKPKLTKLGELLQVSRQTISNYLYLLTQAGLLTMLYPDQHKLSALAKPEKLFLHHPNYYYAISYENLNIGNLRETFFVNQLSYLNQIETSEIGDFKVNNRYIFEIGGKSKNYKQIANVKDAYLVIDDKEMGIGNKIPLWLFGFLY